MSCTLDAAMKHALNGLCDRLLRHLWLPFAGVAAMQFFLLLRLGVGSSPDVARYAGFADQLVASGWNFAEILAPNPGPRLLHIAFITLVAILKTIAGSKWMLALAVINILCHSLTAALIGRTALRITSSALAGMVSLLLFAGCYEVFSWPRWALSDPSFVLLALLVWIWFSNLAAEERTSGWRAFAPVAVAMALVLYRPSALALVPVAIALPLFRRPERRRLLLVMAIVAMTGVPILTAMALQHPERWSGSVVGRPVQRLSTETARGEVVIQRPETFIRGVDSTGDILHVFAARFARYFQFTSQSFSRAHNLLNAVVFVPLYAFYVATIVLLLRGRLSRIEGAHARLSLLWIVSFALLHALTQLDFDWRYRLPVMAPMLIAGAFTVARLVRVQDESSTVAATSLAAGESR